MTKKGYNDPYHKFNNVLTSKKKLVGAKKWLAGTQVANSSSALKKLATSFGGKRR